MHDELDDGGEDDEGIEPVMTVSEVLAEPEPAEFNHEFEEENDLHNVVEVFGEIDLLLGNVDRVHG